LITFAMILIGMNIGAGVTPDIVETVQRWPASFLILACSLFAIMAASAFWLRRVHGFDRRTALLSSSPGHLTFVLSLSADVDADIPRIALAQTIRVLALTLIVPVLVTAIGGTVEGGTVPAPMSLPVIAILLALSLAVGKVFQWIAIPAAMLLGAMAVSTLTHITGIVEGGMPNWLGMPAFLVMGAMIGSRFSGVTLGMLRETLAAGMAITIIASGLASLAAVLVWLWLDLPLGQLIVAFMPGGLEAMIALSVLLNADPAFVAGHHVMRLFILSVLVPVMLGRAKRRS
jgi:membrane AbrB-like protein